MNLQPKNIENIAFQQVKNETLRAMGYSYQVGGWR